MVRQHSTSRSCRPTNVTLPAHLLEELGTRIAVPLLSQSVAPKPAKRLNTVFVIDDQSFVMMTQFMAAVPERDLKKTVT